VSIFYYRCLTSQGESKRADTACTTAIREGKQSNQGILSNVDQITIN